VARAAHRPWHRMLAVAAAVAVVVAAVAVVVAVVAQ
jgi:hypothetical protein